MASSPELIAAHLDHRRAYDDFNYVYPVISRRSQGLSIGINLNPDKACNFDCIYCEVNRTTPCRRKDVDLDLMREELREMLRLYESGAIFEREPFASAPSAWRRLNDIAFSGEGEPTTCPVFEQAVETTLQTRAELGLESVKLVLITNATCLDRLHVRRGVRRMQAGAHEIWTKLDGGTEDYFRVVNGACVPYERIVRNITLTARWCPVVIQSLFLRMFGLPPSRVEIGAYAERLREIQESGGKIARVQLYTIARPAPIEWATALSHQELDRIAAQVMALTGLPLQLAYGEA